MREVDIFSFAAWICMTFSVQDAGLHLNRQLKYAYHLKWEWLITKYKFNEKSHLNLQKIILKNHTNILKTWHFFSTSSEL